MTIAEIRKHLESGGAVHEYNQDTPKTYTSYNLTEPGFHLDAFLDVMQWRSATGAWRYELA